jgi:hypothetical protein
MFDNFTNAVVSGIGDVDIAAAVQRNACGIAEHGAGGGATVAAGIRRYWAGSQRAGETDNCAHRFGRTAASASDGEDAAHPAVACVSDVYVAFGIYGDTLRTIQFRADRRTTITAFRLRAGFADTGYGREIAGCVDFANRIVAGVRNIEIALRVHCKPGRLRQKTLQSGRGFAPVADPSHAGVSRNGVAAHLEDVLRIGRGDIEVALRILDGGRRSRNISAGGCIGCDIVASNRIDDVLTSGERCEQQKRGQACGQGKSNFSLQAVRAKVTAVMRACNTKHGIRSKRFSLGGEYDECATQTLIILPQSNGLSR